MDLGGGSVAMAAGLGGNIDLLGGGLDIITGNPTAAPSVQVNSTMRMLGKVKTEIVGTKKVSISFNT